MGLLLQDLDLIVKTTMVIEREVDDERNIREVSVKDKWKIWAWRLKPWKSHCM